MGKKGNYLDTPPTEYCTIEEGTKLFRVGRLKLTEVAKEANALIAVGRLKRIDIHKLQEYMSKNNEMSAALGTGQNDYYYENIVVDGVRHKVYAKTEEETHDKANEKLRELIQPKNRIKNGQLSITDISNYSVYESTDYDKFKRLIGNRNLKREKISKLKQSIIQYGWLRNPILVNEKFEIIDGQHRYETLKELRMPIEYIVDEGLSIDECQCLNVSQSNWTQKDYINSYVDNGNSNYIYLRKLMDKYNIISLNAIIYAITDQMKAFNKGIREGTFICTEEQSNVADEALNYLIPLIPFIKRIDGRIDFLCIAIIFIYKHENECDMDRLANRIKKYSQSITPPADMKSALDSLETLYNSNNRNKYMSFKNDYLYYQRHKE